MIIATTNKCLCYSAERCSATIVKTLLSFQSCRASRRAISSRFFRGTIEPERGIHKSTSNSGSRKALPTRNFLQRLLPFPWYFLSLFHPSASLSAARLRHSLVHLPLRFPSVPPSASNPSSLLSSNYKLSSKLDSLVDFLH